MQDEFFAQVKRIAHREDGRYLIVLTVGEGNCSEDVEFVILDELFEDVAEELRLGQIDEECVASIDGYAEISAAFSSACASLAYTQCSSKALFRKLLVKGFSKSASEVAVEICKSRGYIDEVEMASRRAEIMVEKLWGRVRILAKLREEGYSDAALDSAREYLDGIDFAEICSRVILKKYRNIPEERVAKEKMYSSLARLGFSRIDIREAVKCIAQDE